MADERIAAFIDYENLAIGAREDLGIEFQFKPIADALAERGRVVVRRAYADWTHFDKDRHMLTANQVELIEIPQRKGVVRKNAADIKMAVDAVELAFEREYVTAFAVCTGDSDFTPLVHKLRELNRFVIGIGLKASTSALLPAACDEFLFYENLTGVDVPDRKPVKQPQPAISADTTAPEAVIVPTVTGQDDLDELSSGLGNVVGRDGRRVSERLVKGADDLRQIGDDIRPQEQFMVIGAVSPGDALREFALVKRTVFEADSNRGQSFRDEPGRDGCDDTAVDSARQKAAHRHIRSQS
ncbi:MAG: NYN domain-containing protein [Acidobacteria bacterium]|nr:NYN domain-containing protein [Acidobacteriota bacterium]